MSGEVAVRNRQRRWRVEQGTLKSLVTGFLGEGLGLADWQLGIHLVSARAMAGLNRRWLGHEGSTDVITFDHRVGSSEPLNGELFVSVDDAALQAQEFRTTPALEVVRYVVHGILHLQGHDDHDPMARRAMKREEDRWVRQLAKRFPLRDWVHSLG